MAQPKEPPLSIRPGTLRLARIDAYAEKHKLSRHLAIMVLLDDALKRAERPPLYEQIAKAEPLPEAPKPSAVFVETVRAAEKAKLAGVQLGPSPFVPRPKTLKPKR